MPDRWVVWDWRGGVGLAGWGGIGGVGGWDWRGEVVGYVAYAEEYYSPEKNNFYPFICPSANGLLRKKTFALFAAFLFRQSNVPGGDVFFGEHANEFKRTRFTFRKY